MSSTLHYAHVDLLGLPRDLGRVKPRLDFRWDVASEADHHRSDNWLGTAFAQLKRRQIDYDIADSHIAPQRLQRYPIACIPAVDFMDAADQQKLLGYVARGGCLIIGPGIPYLDSHMRPCALLNDIARLPGVHSWGEGKLILTLTESLADVLVTTLPRPRFHWDCAAIDVVEQIGEGRRLLFIANTQDQAREVTITGDSAYRYLPVWAEPQSSKRGQQLTLELAPYTIQIWEATHD